MIKHTFIALLCLAPLSFAAADAHPTQGEKKTEAADKRPDLAATLEKLEKHVEKRGSEDADAITIIGQLGGEFTKSGPKDKASIVSALGKCVEAPRTEPKKGEFNDKLAIAAAGALGQMGPESVPTLIANIGQKNLRKDIQLQRELLLSLGKTKDKEGIKTLTINLENKDAPLVAAAAEGMGEFEDAKQDVRKELFSAALKTLMSGKNAKDAEQAGSGATAHTTIATDRYDVISAPLLKTLHRLSKHDESTPELWERWWNKNRQASWESSKP
jgi:HEAT repeat protein